MEQVDGYGYGYGAYGSGYGDDYGSGDGSGYGDGSGSGYGYGDGSGDLCAEYVDSIAAMVISGDHPNGTHFCVWWSDRCGRPSNGGSATPVKAGDVQEVNGPLEICTKRALHGTLCPKAWDGERLWLVALYPPVVGDEIKYASIKRQILWEFGGANL